MNTKKESTAVSGILPIHNGEHWIKKNLENILSTLRQQDELVIVENGSSDRSLKLLTDYKKQDSRINLISLSRPGLVESLNTAINESNNELLARFDIDDSYSPFRLTRQVGKLCDSDQNCGAIFSDYRIASESGFYLGRIYSPIFPFQTKLSLLNSQRTAHPSVLFRRSAVLEAGMYKKDDFPAEDLGLWIRLASISNLISTPECLLTYRRHSNSVSGTKRLAILKISKSLKANLRFSEEDFDFIDNLLSDRLFGYGDIPEGDTRALLFAYDLLRLTRNSNDCAFSRSRLARRLPSVLFKSFSRSTLDTIYGKLARLF